MHKTFYINFESLHDRLELLQELVSRFLKGKTLRPPPQN